MRKPIWTTALALGALTLVPLVAMAQDLPPSSLSTPLAKPPTCNIVYWEALNDLGTQAGTCINGTNDPVGIRQACRLAVADMRTIGAMAACYQRRELWYLHHPKGN